MRRRLSALQLWLRALVVVRASSYDLVAYDLVLKAVAAMVLAPTVAWSLQRLIRRSGALAITNTDIVDFLAMPMAWLFLLAAATLGATVVLADWAGLMRLALVADQGGKLHWLHALRETVRVLPRLATTSLAQVTVGVLSVLPVLGVVGAVYVGLLSEHDINFYLSERPPEFWVAVGIVGAVAVAWLVGLLGAVVQWSLALPVTLREGAAGFAALTRSGELVSNARRRVAVLVLGSAGGTVVIGAVVLGLAAWSVGGLLTLASDVRTQILLTAGGLGVLLVLAFVLSFLALAGHAFIVGRLYAEQTGQRVVTVGQEELRDLASSVGPVAIGLGLAVGVAAALLGSYRLIGDLQLGRTAAVTAHRAGSNDAPENTLAALRQAIAVGADVAEIDVQETRDGVLVVVHDTDFERIAGTPRGVWEMTYAEVAALDVGTWFDPAFADESVPTLSQAMEAARGRIRLNIELKYNGHDQALAERVAQAVLDAGFEAQCVVTSLNQQGLATVRRVAPNIQVGQIVSVAIGDTTALDVDLLSIQSSRATLDVVRENRAAGLETHVWTVNTREDMQRMLERGVDNIITDDPAELRDLLRERAELSDAELLLLALSARLNAIW